MAPGCSVTHAWVAGEGNIFKAITEGLTAGCQEGGWAGGFSRRGGRRLGAEAAEFGEDRRLVVGDFFLGLAEEERGDEAAEGAEEAGTPITITDAATTRPAVVTGNLSP